MAIIEPSLNFEGSHLGDSYYAEPGCYTAVLHSVQINPKSNESYLLEWVLTNRPASNYRWIVRQWFPRKNPGFLSQMLCSWIDKKWGDLSENDDERLEALRKLIGEGARIQVAALAPGNSNSVKVAKVAALDLS